MKPAGIETIGGLSLGNLSGKSLAAALLLVTLAAFFSIGPSEAQVCINCAPAEVTVNEGAPVVLPVVITGGDLSNKPVEVFVWKSSVAAPEEMTFLDPISLWTDFSYPSQMKPLGAVEAMPEGVDISWEAFHDTTGMGSFSLYICIDGTVDGVLPEGENTEGAHCGSIKVNILPKQICSGVYVYNSSGNSLSSISETTQVGTPLTKQYSVKDSCGQSLSFQASENYDWLSLTSQTGALTLTFSSSAAATYSGSLNVISGTATKPLNITLSVTSSSSSNTKGEFGFGGGTCTPSSIKVWPSPLSLSGAQSSIPISQDVSVTNNCSKAISFTATTTSGGSWLSAASKTSGALTVTANTAGLASGTYNGSIKISASGYPDASLPVTLTVTGPCTPSSLKTNPSSISKTVAQGATVGSETVTVTDNCGASQSYTVSAVSGAWISSPAANASGSGSLAVTFNSSGLAVGTNSGSITLTGSLGTATVPVTITVTSGSSTATYIAPHTKISNSTITAGQVKYYYFNETSSRGLGNTNPLRVNLEDPTQGTGMYNVDMVVRYAGATCNDSMKPTMSDYNAIKTGTMSGETMPGSSDTRRWGTAPYYFYSKISGNAFETLQIPSNPEGCYYIMIYNTSNYNENITLFYSDYDSL